MNNIIQFENVSKSFGDLKVLDKLNLEVKDGEKLGLIGPSGSGKTTILRILMTLETIDDGFVSVNGEYLWHEKNNGKKHGSETQKQSNVQRHFNLGANVHRKNTLVLLRAKHISANVLRVFIMIRDP